MSAQTSEKPWLEALQKEIDLRSSTLSAKEEEQKKNPQNQKGGEKSLKEYVLSF